MHLLRNTVPEVLKAHTTLNRNGHAHGLSFKRFTCPSQNLEYCIYSFDLELKSVTLSIGFCQGCRIFARHKTQAYVYQSLLQEMRN